MALPQAFGSASSYARKYCLNGLFMLDDTKDADATNTHDKKPSRPTAGHVKALKDLCKAKDLAWLDVVKWALKVRSKDISLPANAKAMIANWSKIEADLVKWIKENN